MDYIRFLYYILKDRFYNRKFYLQHYGAQEPLSLQDLLYQNIASKRGSKRPMLSGVKFPITKPVLYESCEKISYTHFALFLLCEIIKMRKRKK